MSSPLDTLAARALAHELLELEPNPALVWQPDGAVGDWNEAAAALFGFDRTEALGQQSGELGRTEFAQSWTEVEHALKVHGAWSGSARRAHRDGHVIELQVELTAKEGPDGLYVFESSRPAPASPRTVEQQLDVARTVARELERAFAQLGLGRPLLPN